MKQKYITTGSTALLFVASFLISNNLLANEHRKMIEAIHRATDTVIADPNCRKAFGTLIETAKGEGPFGEVRSYALNGLGRIGAEYASTFHEEAIPVIVEALDSEDGFVVAEAAKAAGRYRSYAEPAISALLETIKSHPTAIIPSIDSLAEIGGRPDIVIPILAQMIPNRDPQTGQPRWARGYELEAIGAFGENAKMAIPYLTEALNDPEIRYALLAARAFAKVEPKNEDLIDFLKNTYRKGNQEDRFFVLVAIKEMKMKKYPESLQSLIALGMNDPSKEIRELAQSIELTE